MNTECISKATLGRLPIYLQYLKSLKTETKNISATKISKDLGLGEVQVRKDLGAVCKMGKPKTGYVTEELKRALEQYLFSSQKRQAVIVGAGKLGCALLDYGGFSEYGIEIIAAFDKRNGGVEFSDTGKCIYPMKEFDGFCYHRNAPFKRFLEKTVRRQTPKSTSKRCVI